VVRFTERWEGKKSKAPEEAVRVVADELEKLSGLEPVSPEFNVGGGQVQVTPATDAYCPFWPLDSCRPCGTQAYTWIVKPAALFVPAGDPQLP
jgi:hypothetical protein